MIIWDKPGQCPDWMEQAIYQAMPDQLLLREVKVEVREKGMRCRSLMVVSTLLDADAFTSADLAQLYRARWHFELDLRSLKSTMQMDVLRGKTPDMVGKEIWAHLLAYNLIRTVMAQSAEQYQLLPREISFKGALQTINAFGSYLGTPRSDLSPWSQALLRAIAQHRVANRPNRVEPRAVKRRPKPHALLNVPRTEARKQLLANT